MTKKRIKLIISLIIAVAILLYFMFAYISGELNIFEYELPTRLMFCVYMLITFPVVGVINTSIPDDY